MAMSTMVCQWKSSAEAHFVKGVENGIRKTWYENGQLKSEAEIEKVQIGQRLRRKMDF